MSDITEPFKRIAAQLALSALNTDIAADALDDAEQAAGEAYQHLQDAKKNNAEWKAEVI